MVQKLMLMLEKEISRHVLALELRNHSPHLRTLLQYAQAFDTS
jgi:hypothetical protein